MKHVAVLGYGTVGSGVVEIIGRNKKELANNSGDEVSVKYILDLRDFPGDPYEDKIIHDFDIIVKDPEVSIVCETMGGTGAAYTFTKACLENGKSVCTSNKALVAAHGPELLKIAKQNNCSYMFEASVGGGIPIIRPLQTCLTAEHIECIIGILNGTTNFMLTKMDEEGCDYDEILKEAQRLGYAEQNPEADVCGYDTCRKIAILTSLYMGKTVNYEDIKTEGITKITTKEFKYAAELGRSIKLLGISKDLDGKCLALVAPFMVSAKSPLYGVRDVFNGIMVTGNMVEDVMFYGRGAGKLATASAVVADIVECAKNVGKNVPCIWKDEAIEMATDADKKFAYFVRVNNAAKDKFAASFEIENTVNIDEASDETGFVTKEMTEDKFIEVVETFGEDVINYVRMF